MVWESWVCHVITGRRCHGNGAEFSCECARACANTTTTACAFYERRNAHVSSLSRTTVMSSADFVEELVLEMLRDAPRGLYANRKRDFERDAHEYIARNSREPLDKRIVARYMLESRAIQSHEALLSSSTSYTDDVESGATPLTDSDTGESSTTTTSVVDENIALLSEFEQRVLRVIEQLHARIIESIERRAYTKMTNGVVFVDAMLEFDIDLYAAVMDAIERNFSEPSLSTSTTPTLDMQTPYVWFTRELARTATTTLALFVFRCRRDPHSSAASSPSPLSS